MDIKAKIFQVLKQRTKSNFNESTKFSDLDLDSLDLIELVIQVEKELEIQIPDEALVKLETISDFLNLIEKNYLK